MMIGLNKKKRALTLIELLVVITLIATLAAVVGWRVKDFFAKNQLLLDRKRLESILKMGRSSAILTETDWQLCFYEEDGKTKIKWFCPEDPEAKSFFSTQTLSQGVKVFYENEKKHLSKITFFSTGAVSHLGKLRLEAKNYNGEIYLDKILNLSLNLAPSIEEIFEKG